MNEHRLGWMAAFLIAGCGGSAGPNFGDLDSGVHLGAARVVAPGSIGIEAAGQILYVPIYSHVYHSDSAASYNLSALLSVRNADRAGSIVVKSVDYHDVRGRRLRGYLEQPVEVPPLGVVECYLRESDTTGGSSASFLVEWTSERAEAVSPVVEAVMIGTTGAQGISFVTEARVVWDRSEMGSP